VQTRRNYEITLHINVLMWAFLFIPEDPMTVDSLKKKYEAECEAYKRIGIFKRYSFLLKQSNDHREARKVLLEDNFSRTEVTRAKSRYDNYLRKKNVNQSISRGNAF